MQRNLILGGGIGLIALVAIGTGAVYVAAQRAEAPQPLGVQNGRLTPCPDTPNCVSSSSTVPQSAMLPLAYSGETARAKAAVLALLQSYPRVTILQDDPDYVHALFRSPTLGFPDDVEVYIDATTHLIQFRSAARMGRGDLGVNRKRMTDIRTRLEATLR